MSNTSIYFHSESSFVLKKKRALRQWLNASIAEENAEAGAINFIFCDDEYLHDLNKKYLHHDTLTDIITFDNREPAANNQQPITADIFISTERVRDNAKNLNTKFDDELHRVMIHGILHLLSYNDKTSAQKTEMCEKEDYYLSLRSY
ncbi:MAG: rRNA maturation RNase YbeY [Flavobacteriales bacterium]|nr:MAG: rRNA maturation RNase YbeY [Flavobacteriales bacterium]